MTVSIESLSTEEIKGSVDFALIAIREDEFDAVLHFFPPTGEYKGKNRTYEISDFKTSDGSDYRAALFRTTEQGHGAAQAAASDVISDLDPAWLVLVGIAGAVPETEFSLGDVVVATRIIDFSVTAALANGATETALKSSPAHKAIQDLATRLRALKLRLGDWNTLERLCTSLPSVLIDDEHLPINDDTWAQKLRYTLEYRFQSNNGSQPRLPIVTATPIASGNMLMKDSALLQEWLKIARDLKSVEMELPGVYEAARHKDGDKPVLAIRGISDIVGFKRDHAWTEFACKTAASLTRALLNTKPIEPKIKHQYLKGRANHTSGENINVDMVATELDLDSAAKVDLSQLVKRLHDASAQELISDLISGRWGASDLAELARDAELGKKALVNLACPILDAGDTWRRMLFTDLCAEIEDPTDTILDIAFDDRVRWEHRTGTLSSLRLLRKSARIRAKSLLDSYAEQDDMDQIRLTVEGYGFLGELSAIRWLSSKEYVGSDNYATEKLGSYVALGYLNCFVHFYDETSMQSPLDAMSKMLDAMKQRGNEIHPFDFMRRLQLLRPGLAPELFKHAVQRKHATLLEGLLYVLNQRGTPYLANELYGIARGFSKAPKLANNALKALSSIQGEAAQQLLERAVDEDIPNASSMLLLSIGINRARQHADIVLREINYDTRKYRTVDRNDEHMLFALWAAGELGREDPSSFVMPLLNATLLQDAPLVRAYAWLGLAKIGHPNAASELRAAAKFATNFVEHLIIGIAGLYCGHSDLIAGAIHVSQLNNAPVWKLEGHLYRDFQRGLDVGLGERGGLLLQLLERGDLS